MPCSGCNSKPKPSYRLIYNNNTYPSLNNFKIFARFPNLNSSTLQSMEQYNRIYLFAAYPSSKVRVSSKNQDGCGYCSQCCFNGFDCGCYCNGDNDNNGCCAC